jgi:hypothetical protein
MKKNLKITLFSGLLLSAIVSVGCIPQAFQGLPSMLTQVSANPNSRADLCNLLLTVGGTQADVDTCLTATSITQAQIERLCALSNNLTDAQKEILRAGLTSQGVNVEEACPIARVGGGTPSSAPTSVPTAVPTAAPTEAPTSSPTEEPVTPTANPTATTSPSAAPSASPTSGTGGGNTAGGFGSGTSETSGGLSGTVANDTAQTPAPVDD